MNYDVYILAILAAILIVELLRLALPYRRQNRKGHFTNKLEGATKMIWDLEFKLFKSREIREDIRREYDAAQSKLHSTTKQLEVAKPEEKPRLEDHKSILERDVQRYQAQMNQLDLEMEGSRPTNEHPDGVTGISQQIDSFKELEKMLQDFIKTL